MFGLYVFQNLRNGRPLLITKREVAALVRHFRPWSRVHLALTVAALTGLSVFECAA